MPPLSIMIKPASSSCNLRCTYCFYADEAQSRSVPNYGLMSGDTSRILIEKAMGAASGSVAFLFQGGEPTLAGLDFFRSFLRDAEVRRPRDLSVHYAIQTNGTLLDEDWCRFLAENHILVGLSLDGSRDCHDRFRRDGLDKGTFDRVLRAARMLEKAGAEYNVLTVVTGYLARHIQSAFSFFCKNNFRYQQYIPCLDPLEGRRGGQDWSLTPERYEAFLKRLFDLWYRELEQGRYWSVRYFDNLLQMLRGRPPEQCSLCGVCSPQYLVEADGSVYPCDFYGLDRYRLGNVTADSWEDLDRTREQTGFIAQSMPVPEKCGQCRWYPLCRNGCRRDRLPAADGGPGLNYYCPAYAGFFDYALPRLQKAARALCR